MFNPRHPLAAHFNQIFQRDVRRHFFSGVHFDAPMGDPGWFGPGSAIWHVFSHHYLILLGLGVAGAIEASHPDTEAANNDHSRIWTRDAAGRSTGRMSIPGNRVRQGHTLSFFLGCVFGPTAVAERLTHTVRHMHNRVHGTAASGRPYDANDAHLFRWNYATLAWAFASTHRKYHHDPLRGDDLEQFYREFVRIGEALGGRDLPASSAAVHACLHADGHRLKAPDHLENYQVAVLQGVAHHPLRRIIPDMYQWSILEAQPDYVQQLIGFERGPALLAATRIEAMRLLLRSIIELGGPLPEIQAAYRRALGQRQPAVSTAVILPLRTGS